MRRAHHLAVGDKADLRAARVRVHGVAGARRQRHQRLPVAVARQAAQERVLRHLVALQVAAIAAAAIRFCVHRKWPLSASGWWGAVGRTANASARHREAARDGGFADAVAGEVRSSVSGKQGGTCSHGEVFL